MAAFDMDDPKAVVSPGGVGFDINCGVRLLRTNLTESDILPIKVCIVMKLFLVLFYSLLVNWWTLVTYESTTLVLV